jgi:hypothetical protein
MKAPGYFLLAAGALAFSPVSVRAQDAQRPVPPSGELLAAAPSYAKWTVNFSYLRAGAPGEPPMPAPAQGSQLKSITTTRTRGIVHLQTVDGNGATGDRWFVDNTEYFQLTGSPTWYETHPGSGTGSVKFDGPDANGYMGLDWITPKGYMGLTQFGGRPCLVLTRFYADAARNKLVSPGEYQTLDSYALIDAGTRLPAQIKDNGTVETYQFDTAPTDRQQLPDDLAKVIKNVEDMRARLSQPPPRPY